MKDVLNPPLKDESQISQNNLSIPTPLVLRVRKIYLYNAGEPSYPSLGIDATVFHFRASFLPSFFPFYVQPIPYMHSLHPPPYRHSTLSLVIATSSPLLQIVRLLPRSRDRTTAKHPKLPVLNSRSRTQAHSSH